jgi:hypothetical protein
MRWSSSIVLKATNRGRPLLVYLAELLLQFRDFGLCAFVKFFVADPAEQCPVLHDLHFEFYALVVGRRMHGLTARIRRERAALSVTDDCRGRDDD